MQQPLVVLITGASAGLGRAIAHAYAKRDAKLGLLARNTEAPLERIVGRLSQSYATFTMGCEIIVLLATADFSNVEGMAAASRIESLNQRRSLMRGMTTSIPPRILARPIWRSWPVSKTLLANHTETCYQTSTPRSPLAKSTARRHNHLQRHLSREQVWVLFVVSQSKKPHALRYYCDSSLPELVSGEVK